MPLIMLGKSWQVLDSIVCEHFKTQTLKAYGETP